MPEINRLPTRRLTAGDTFPFFSTNNGDAAKASFTALANLMADLLGIANPAQNVTQYESPEDSFEITIEENESNTWLIVTPAASGYSGDIIFPSAAEAFDGMTITISTDAAITFSYSSTGASFIGAITEYEAGGGAVFKYDAVAKRWYQISVVNEAPPA